MEGFERVYNVLFRSVWENEEVQDVTFAVKFENPLTVTVANLSLKTLTTETSLEVRDYTRVTLKDRVLYVGSQVRQSGETTGWQTGSDFYVNQATAFNFSNLTTNSTDPDNLKLENSSTGKITWLNKGGSLLNNLTETIKVSFTAQTCAIKETTETITLLKSN